MAFARDKFLLFGCPAHDDDIWLLPDWRTQKVTYGHNSRITPAEGAFMLDIPNMAMVKNADGVPAAFSKDAIGYMESFCAMDRMIWSAMGSGGFRTGNEEKFICELAEKYRNVTGVYLDDLLSPLRKKGNADPEALREMLREIREGLNAAPRPMKLYATWYWHDDPPKFLEDFVDTLVFWTWNSEDLVKLRERFESVEKKFKKAKLMLGVYFYDYYNRRPVTDEMMELQCGYGLSLMKEGRLDGMMFLGNNLLGAQLPSEYWLREWVEKVKYTEVPD